MVCSGHLKVIGVGIFHWWNSTFSMKPFVPIPGLIFWKDKNHLQPNTLFFGQGCRIGFDFDGQPMCRGVYVFTRSIRCISLYSMFACSLILNK